MQIVFFSVIYNSSEEDKNYLSTSNLQITMFLEERGIIMEKFEIAKSSLYVEESGYFDGPIEFSNGHIKVRLWIYGQDAKQDEKLGDRFELKEDKYQYGPAAKNGWVNNGAYEYRKDAVNKEETKFWHMSSYYHNWIDTSYDKRSQQEIWNKIAEDTELFNKTFKELAANI